jgi:hypothetical protein
VTEASQIADKRTKNRLTLDSRQTQTPEPTTAYSAFLDTKAATVRNEFNFFFIARTAHSYSQIRRTRLLHYVRIDWVWEHGLDSSGSGHGPVRDLVNTIVDILIP